MASEVAPRPMLLAALALTVDEESSVPPTPANFSVPPLLALQFPLLVPMSFTISVPVPLLLWTEPASWLVSFHPMLVLPVPPLFLIVPALVMAAVPVQQTSKLASPVLSMVPLLRIVVPLEPRSVDAAGRF